MRLTLANGITLARLLFVPPMLFLLWKGYRAAAFGLLLPVLAGDLVDGALARLRSEVTELGKLLDPVVDKIVFLAVLGALVWMGDLPWVTLILLAVLQLGIALGAVLWFRQRRDAPWARLSGKIASFVLALGLLATFLHISYYDLIVYAGIALTYIAGFDYLLNFLRAMKSPSDKAGIRAEERR